MPEFAGPRVVGGTRQHIAWYLISYGVEEGGGSFVVVTLVSTIPSTSLAPRFANTSRRLASYTTMASRAASSAPTSCSLRRSCVATAVMSWAVPTYRCTAPDVSRTGATVSATTVSLPSSAVTAKVAANVAPEERAESQRASISARTAGTACDHGATPSVSGAPPNASARNASLAEVSRPSTSVSHMATGSRASARSMRQVSQVSSCGCGNVRRPVRVPARRTCSRRGRRYSSPPR